MRAATIHGTRLGGLLASSRGAVAHAPLPVVQGPLGLAQHAAALHIAARAGHLDVAKTLCENGADVNSLGPWEMTPVMYAVIFGKQDMVEFLLSKNADLTKKDARGRCALTHAKNEKQPIIEQVLAQHEEK